MKSIEDKTVRTQRHQVYHRSLQFANSSKTQIDRTFSHIRSSTDSTRFIGGGPVAGPRSEGEGGSEETLEVMGSGLVFGGEPAAGVEPGPDALLHRVHDRLVLELDLIEPAPDPRLHEGGPGDPAQVPDTAPARPRRA